MLTRLSLTDFRNHADAVIAAAPGFVILTGENGAGKTNILEAISLLAPGRGLRGAALGEMARQDGPGGFGVAARLGDVDLATGTQASSPERRLVRVNGAQQPATALGEWLSMVWVTPAMDRLFNDSAGERRRFIDRLTVAFEPRHAHHANRYDAAMRQRNRLLAHDPPADPHWLRALEGQMAEHGLALDAARRRAVAAIGAAIGERMQGPFACAALSLTGFDPGVQPDFARMLATGRERDRAAGRTLIGPHRADLDVVQAETGQPAARCSTGEQKTLLFGIALAHGLAVAAASGRAPVLLLDEVTAHLDPARRAILFAQLRESGAQVWMTGTDAQIFDAAGSDAARLHVAGGRISG